MTDHARLAPSASHRWLNCTESVNTAARYSDQQSVEAAEGTAAHWVLEQCLAQGGNPKDFVGRTIVVRENHLERKFVVDKDMASDVAIGVDYMRDVVKQSGWSGVETRVDLSFLDPEMFGTCDIWHVSQDLTLTLPDFKYGHGDVSPIENTQEMLYACGIVNMIYRGILMSNMPEQIRLVVIQPRSVVPGPRIKEWFVPKGYVEPFIARVQDAITEIHRFPTFRMGAWCKHCPALGECPPTAAELTLVGSQLPVLQSADMTIADATRVLERKDLLESIVKKAESVMLKALMNGHKDKRFPLVTGTKHRQWRDDDLAKQRLADEFGPGCLKPPTPAAAEKLGNGAKKIVADLAFTPPGDPTVGKEGDKRPPYIAKSATQMFGPPS
jgi:Protein of unknown function (DUF2800)